MNPANCEREDQVSAAIRSGTMEPEIAAHARQCPVCSEILLVGEFLTQNGVLADHERSALPDPAVIYQRARLQSQQKAVRLALRPIRVMTVVAFVVFACSPWLGLVLPFGKELSASWSRSLDSTLAFVSKSWPVMPNQPVILLASFGTIILLALSSWYMLREE